ncbi:MAG TPA: ArdC-like ssDNA-binding domain-containing protein [Solirubrobacteraceae bacterium]|nr:ArdC-like ssDNA-binding domain-containing protein [Solirubrobacteraceae bacterium]
MAKAVVQRPTEQEHAQRRRADRERLRDAAEELLSPEGWMRWVQARATLRGYSAANCMLLAQQCHERGILPQRVRGLYAWRKSGRRVRKGETALRISAPVAFRQRDEDGADTGERRVFFKTSFVFELSQTELLPGDQQQTLAPPCEPMNDSSHERLLAPLQAFAESLGYAVSFEAISGSSRGWCDTERRQIAIDDQVPANAQVRTLIHECVHALGVDYERYPRDRAEVIADTITFVVSASVGLAVDAESIPFVASWGKDGALAAVTECARTIDTIARRIEAEALGSVRPG